jgi:hypothetical protein
VVNLVNSVPDLLPVKNSIIPAATSIKIIEPAPYADAMPAMGSYPETV